MLSRDDTVFTIGYDGDAAVVDGQAKRKYASLKAGELAEKGLFRAAYQAALYSKDPGDIKTVLETYNRLAGTSYSAESAPHRLFGVFPLENIKRVILL
ncbi:MAG: hypothetical protein LBI85_07645 [Spirochaetaceae bacterium]|jgi:pectin methylesterase-like acyl-CoA thioesterase|nr:hypothetical protein [Spirochaetaceae bacterium]